MLFIQLLHVLLTRPKRGKSFWWITAYSGVTIALTTISIGGKIKFAEYLYVTSLFDNVWDSAGNKIWVPSLIAADQASLTVNVLSRIW